MDYISNIKSIASKYNIDCIGLFGSRARGDFNAYSDYDIFIIGDISLNEELKLEGELEVALKHTVDLIRLDDETSKNLAKNILNDAKVILNRNKAFERRYEEVDNFFIENSDFIRRRERELLD